MAMLQSAAQERESALSKRLAWILAVVALLCLAAAAAGVALLASDLPLSPSPTSPLPSDTAPAPTAELPPTSTPGLPAETRRSMDEIQGQVVALRGLNPLGSVERALLTSAELRERVLDDFLSDYTPEEAAYDARMLALLGLLEPGVDLWALYTDLLSEQVAGYYDDQAGAMFVVREAGFGGPERLTYAHEFVHALQDQHYDLDEGLGYSNEACDDDADRCAALSAMLEGDATLLETQWLRTYATEQDFQEIQEFIATFESPVFDTAPGFLQEDLLFPYIRGIGFVTELFVEGNWAAVDEAYSRPPASTEQILHPGRYPDDLPILLTSPDLTPALGGDWSELGRRVLGEWYTLLTLESFLPSETATEAAQGWGGDYVLVLTNEATGADALVLVTRWDTLIDAQDSFAAFAQYGDARFGSGSHTTTTAVWVGDGAYALLERSADQTLWILAPDEPFAEALRQAIPFPAAVQ